MDGAGQRLPKKQENPIFGKEREPDGDHRFIGGRSATEAAVMIMESAKLGSPQFFLQAIKTGSFAVRPAHATRLIVGSCRAVHTRLVAMLEKHPAQYLARLQGDRAQHIVNVPEAGFGEIAEVDGFKPPLLATTALQSLPARGVCPVGRADLFVQALRAILNFVQAGQGGAWFPPELENRSKAARLPPGE